MSTRSRTRVFSRSPKSLQIAWSFSGGVAMDVDDLDHRDVDVGEGERAGERHKVRVLKLVTPRRDIELHSAEGPSAAP